MPTFEQNVLLYEYWNQLENKMYYVNYRSETGDASQATQPQRRIETFTIFEEERLDKF